MKSETTKKPVLYIVRLIEMLLTGAVGGSVAGMM